MRKATAFILGFSLIAVPAAASMTTATLSAREDFARRLEAARRKYKSVKDYEAVFVKQERIAGKMRPRERGFFKFRKPFAVYVKWIEGPDKGTEVLYVRGKNDGKLIAHPTGLLGFKTYHLDPKGRVAMRNHRHPVTEAGIGHLIEIIAENYHKATAAGCAEVRRLLPDDPKAKPRGPRFELIVKGPRKPDYYCKRAVVTFDPKTGLVVAVQVYDWDDLLIEDYRYLHLRLNRGLTERDFDPGNPQYGF